MDKFVVKFRFYFSEETDQDEQRQRFYCSLPE